MATLSVTSDDLHYNSITPCQNCYILKITTQLVELMPQEKIF